MIDRLSDAFGFTETQSRLVFTLVWLLALFIARWAVLAVVHRRVLEPSVWYRTQKMLSYAITIVGAIVVASIWIEGSGFATYIGFLTAGLAIALSDVLKNLAGWLFIVTRRPFRLGDRVEVGPNKGDVIDIKAFRFTLFEIGGDRVGAEQPTGRLTHVPNGVVFTQPVANYTEGFGHVWLEIPVLVTFESNWERAREIIRDAIIALTPPEKEIAALDDIRRTMKEYRIPDVGYEPEVYLTVRDSGVLLTARLLVEAHGMRGIEESVWTAVLRGFGAAGDIALAYPTERHV